MSLEFSTTRGGDRIVFGARTLGMIGSELDGLDAQRVLVVSTAGRAEAGRRVAAILRDRCVGVLAIAEPHVPVALARQGGDEARRLDADWIVAVGGGSAIGLAKAVALEQEVRVAAVPTTYAGSEMTDIYGITEGDRKRTGRDARVRPRLVIYDVTLTLDLPVAISCTSGFNAMAHAVEALYAPDVDPLAQMAAEEAIRLLARHLPEIVEAPRDAGARSALLYAAHLAGTCLGSASMGLHHKLCHVLGGSFGLPHAATHTVILPHVIHWQHEAAAPAIARVASALGRSEAGEAAGALYDLVARVVGPTSLRALGLQEGDVERAAARAAEVAAGRANRSPERSGERTAGRSGEDAPYRTARPVDRASIRALLHDAYHGHRPGQRPVAPSPAPDAAPDERDATDP